MPNVNLTDSRSRDAVVKAEPTGIDEEVRYVDDEKKSAYTRKVLKATVEHDYETLVKHHEGDAEALGKALVEDDPEVDMEICGLYLWGVSKVYVDSSDGIVYRIEQEEIVRGPDGSIREKRPRNQPEANVDSEIPLTWTGRKFNKDEAVRRFVFASKLQIVHINGLTYDFLYGMAKELSESNVLMMIGGGSKGRDPLVFRRGSVPYRGFLEGRVDGDKYLLLLHLSNLELKIPSDLKGTKKDSSDKKLEESSANKASSKTKATAKTLAKDKNQSEAKKAKEESEEKPEEVTAKKSKSDTELPENKEQEKKEPKKQQPEKQQSEKKEAKKATPKKPKKKSSENESDKPKASDRKELDQNELDSSNSDNKQSQSTEDAILKSVKTKNPESETVSVVTSEDLGIWLKSIRMGKYLKLFVEHEIDVDVLTELTDEDLKELDIPLGSRRRLLKAVEETDNLHAEVANAVKQMTGSKKAASEGASKATRQKK